MKRYRKWKVILLAAAAAALWFTGCSNQKAQKEQTEKNSHKEDETANTTENSTEKNTAAEEDSTEKNAASAEDNTEKNVASAEDSTEKNAASAAADTEINTEEPEYHKISVKEAKDEMDQNENAVILDVRTQEEYDLGHIPGAICIPNETIKDSRPEELPDLNQTILVYCRSGNRSKQAAGKLAAMGYTNVLEFGGITDWPYAVTR